MITAPLPRASPSGSGRLSMIIPQNHGLTITYIIYVIVINQMRGLYEIYKSRDTRAKPECQGFMNRVQTERWFITIL